MLISILIGVLGRGFYQELFDIQTFKINECSNKLGQLSKLPDQLNTLEMDKNQLASRYQECMTVQQSCFDRLSQIKKIADVDASDDNQEGAASDL